MVFGLIPVHGSMRTFSFRFFCLHSQIPKAIRRTYIYNNNNDYYRTKQKKKMKRHPILLLGGLLQMQIAQGNLRGAEDTQHKLEDPMKSLWSEYGHAHRTPHPEGESITTLTSESLLPAASDAKKAGLLGIVTAHPPCSTREGGSSVCTFSQSQKVTNNPVTSKLPVSGAKLDQDIINGLPVSDRGIKNTLEQEFGDYGGEFGGRSSAERLVYFGSSCFSLRHLL
jgi:hypothetical protein